MLTDAREFIRAPVGWKQSF